ncbi:TPA: hypothetical protein LA750_001662 [Clostridium botulinum]|uniref:hypothetical protein n=1 Tax=Clostridium botulinum TaxID=1491 RepID=UPI001C9AF440|nr:hypothetical protein [Clostridium botulinum]MBY6888777.1 hypothetical protein [Clostridium botulinum]HBJ2609709.1 hypothetical protein [Clostridium botulinum]HDI3120738.1 hypothetical protein [Clostridium botulinum]
MKILAWIGLVMVVLNVIIKLNQTFTEEKVSSRVFCFIGTLIYSSLLYFFFMYLFKQ